MCVVLLRCWLEVYAHIHACVLTGHEGHNILKLFIIIIIIIIINNIDFHFRAFSKTLNESVNALRLEFSMTQQY